tara:strand:+ start:234 stop:905 length:672 start_codon:yes stop_codon:yes gene_type:complete
MKKILIKAVFSLLVFAFSFKVTASDKGADTGNAMELWSKYWVEIQSDNKRFKGKHSKEFFDAFKTKQTPRITLVTCSDSRVQVTAFDETSQNDTFVIRNAGNQIQNTLGSVEYGIDHLHSKILLIVGHSRCGAVKAAQGDYSALSPALKKELDSLSFDKALDLHKAVIDNINEQVKFSMEHFKSKIKNNELVVVGMLYDFTGDYTGQKGSVKLLSLNGKSTEK